MSNKVYVPHLSRLRDPESTMQAEKKVSSELHSHIKRIDVQLLSNKLHILYHQEMGNPLE